MLKNDKKQESELEKEKDLEEKCRISVVGTPKMLKASRKKNFLF